MRTPVHALISTTLAVVLATSLMPSQAFAEAHDATAEGIAATQAVTPEAAESQTGNAVSPASAIAESDSDTANQQPTNTASGSTANDAENASPSSTPKKNSEASSSESGIATANDANANVNSTEANNSAQTASITADVTTNSDPLAASLQSGTTHLVAAQSTYDHSDSATGSGITLKVEWNDPTLGEPTTFHVSATGGSGSYLFRMSAPSYSSPGEYQYESVADPSRGEWMSYSSECSSKDYSFTMTATGTYNFRFYVMDKTAGVYWLFTNTFISVADDNYPSVASIVENAVSQAKEKIDGSEYQLALSLHDWLLDQLDYDNSLKWSSSEAALTRGLGTCQAYESAYSKLLTAAGIENEETRDEANGHTWNAMKIDGTWCQVDCTWDDSKETGYDFDRTHLYFGLTDELMAIAHTKWQSSNNSTYGKYETSLANNYFVRNGKAAEWAAAYADRIQEHLNAADVEFSITADNAYNPPSVIGIQNGIIAYAMNEKTWETSDGAVVLTASSSVTTFSNTSWKALFNFVAKYHEPAVPRIADDGDYRLASGVDVSFAVAASASGCSLSASAGALRLERDAATGLYRIMSGGLALAGVNTTLKTTILTNAH